MRAERDRAGRPAARARAPGGRRHAAGDSRLPRADRAPERARRRGPPPRARRPVPNGVPDAEGACGRAARRAEGARRARARRPARPAIGPASELTAHEQRLLMLASALATEPRVLLLDEPAAGGSAAELDRLAELLHELRDSGLALLVIEHNLRFVRRVADEVTRSRGRPSDRVRHTCAGRLRRRSEDGLPGTTEALVQATRTRPRRSAAVLAGCGGDKGSDKSQDGDDRRQRAVLADAVRRRDDRRRRRARRRRRPQSTSNGVKYRFRIKRYDTGLSPQHGGRATSGGRSPTARSRSSTRAPASTPRGRSPRDADIPLGDHLPGRRSASSTRTSGRTSSASRRPTTASSFRLAEYLIPKRLKVALLTDDTRYGQEGAKALDQAFGAEPGVGRGQADRPGRGARSRAAGAPRPPRRRDGAARLGAADDDRRRAHRGAQLGLEGAGLHAADRRGPARPPAARRTTRTGSTG